VSRQAIIQDVNIETIGQADRQMSRYVPGPHDRCLGRKAFIQVIRLEDICSGSVYVCRQMS